MQHRHVETAIVEELDDRRIGQKPLKIGGAGLAGGDLHNVRSPIAAGYLHDADPIAADGEPQRLRVNRRRLAERRFGRQIIAVKPDHRRRNARPREEMTRGPWIEPAWRDVNWKRCKNRRWRRRPIRVAYGATQATTPNSSTRRATIGGAVGPRGPFRVRDAARIPPWARAAEKRRNGLDRRALRPR